MEEVATPPQDQSSDPIVTSEEFEDLGSSSANENGGISKQEIKDVHSGVMASKVVEREEMSRQPSTNKIEIGNVGNLADVQVTLDKALNDETPNSDGLLKSNDSDSQSCTVFNRISYLGSTTVNAPQSESELQKKMSILNKQSSEQLVKISLSIPLKADGCVILHEAESNTEIGRHPVRRITFLARGAADTSESSCFAFTCPREDSEETAVFQCNLFRCEIAEVIPEVMRSLIQVCYEGGIERPIESQGLGTSSTSVLSVTPKDEDLSCDDDDDDEPLPSGSGGMSDNDEHECSLLPESRTVFCSGLSSKTKVTDKDIVTLGSKIGPVEKTRKIRLGTRRKFFTGEFSVTFEKEKDAQEFSKQENLEFKDQRLKLSMKRVFETAPPEGDSVLRVMFGIPQTKEELAKGMKSYSENVFYVDMESGEQAVVFLHGIGEADRVAEIAAGKTEFLVNGVFCFVEVVSDDERDTLLVKLQARLGDQASPAKKPKAERLRISEQRVANTSTFTNAMKK